MNLEESAIWFQNRMAVNPPDNLCQLIDMHGPGEVSHLVPRQNQSKPTKQPVLVNGKIGRTASDNISKRKFLQQQSVQLEVSIAF